MCKTESCFIKIGILRFLQLIYICQSFSVWLRGTTSAPFLFLIHPKGIDCIIFISLLCIVNCFIYGRWDSQFIFIIANPLLWSVFMVVPSISLAMWCETINMNVKQWSCSCVENAKGKGNQRSFHCRWIHIFKAINF